MTQSSKIEHIACMEFNGGCIVHSNNFLLLVWTRDDLFSLDLELRSKVFFKVNKTIHSECLSQRKPFDGNYPHSFYDLFLRV